jgi:hypothetical protein
MNSARAGLLKWTEDLCTGLKDTGLKGADLRSERNRWLSLLLLPLLLSAVVVAGCVAFPIKFGEEEALAGRRIRPEDLAFLKPGITTRDEVVSKLGAPTLDLSDLGILSYVWIELKEDWAAIWALPNPRLPLAGVFFTPRTGDWALFVATDENGYVVRAGLDQRKPRDSIRSQARKWAEAQELKLPPVQTSFATLPIPDGKALIYFYRTSPSVVPFFGAGASWSWPIAVSVDGQYVTEMYDDTYAAIPVLPGQHEIVVDPLPPYRYVMRGSFTISPSERVPARLIVEAVEGQQYFLEVLSTSGRGSIDTSLRRRNESDAQPILRWFRPVW